MRHLASGDLIQSLLDLPTLAVGKVGKVVDEGEGLLWGRVDVARADRWLCDLAADGDEESVASLRAGEGWKERGGA